MWCNVSLGFSAGSVGKEYSYNSGDWGSILWLGRSPGEENGNPLQYSCLEDSMDRGAWRAIIHRVIKSQTWLKWLGMHTLLLTSLFSSFFPPPPVSSYSYLSLSSFLLPLSSSPLSLSFPLSVFPLEWG